MCMHTHTRTHAHTHARTHTHAHTHLHARADRHAHVMKTALGAASLCPVVNRELKISQEEEELDLFIWRQSNCFAVSPRMGSDWLCDGSLKLQGLSKAKTSPFSWWQSLSAFDARGKWHPEGACAWHCPAVDSEPPSRTIPWHQLAIVLCAMCRSSCAALPLFALLTAPVKRKTRQLIF